MAGESSSNKILVILLLALYLHLQTSLPTATVETHITSYDSAPAAEATPTNDLKEGYNDEYDEADTIIQRSYAQSYAHILPCDEHAPSGRLCMKKTLDYFNDSTANNTTISPTIPWWFQTLLRDTRNNGVYGHWHHFTTTNPSFDLQFCSIEKVATTEWRKVFCKLNADDYQPDSKECHKKTTKKMPPNAPFAVFLRDPLERLLSGFLDKCYKHNIRKGQQHCEPNIIFSPVDNLTNGNDKMYPSLIKDLEGRDKQFFASYVDVMPLKWDMHFVPQAIVCDLHRDIDSFEFVGNMGQDFMFDLEKMAIQYGGPLPEILNSTFGYMEHVQSGKRNTGKDRDIHSTNAPEKVQQFYTAQAVRRGLELLSIDYVLLGLQVPGWARKMLKDDELQI